MGKAFKCDKCQVLFEAEDLSVNLELPEIRDNLGLPEREGPAAVLSAEVYVPGATVCKDCQLVIAKMIVKALEDEKLASNTVK